MRFGSVQARSWFAWLSTAHGYELLRSITIRVRAATGNCSGDRPRSQ